MLTLFHAPRSRSSTMLWVLEELGADYEIRFVSISRNDGSGGPDPDNPHPHKQVPALLHDGSLVTQQVAIGQYLCDLFPQSPIGRPIGHRERGAYLSWLAYYAGVFEPSAADHFEKLTEDRPHRARTYDFMAKTVEGALSRSPYLLGNEVSLPDFFFAGALGWFRSLLPEGRAIDDYVARMTGRPALARAMAKDAPADAADG